MVSGENDDSWWYRTASFFMTMQGVTLLSRNSCAAGNGRFWNFHRTHPIFIIILISGSTIQVGSWPPARSSARLLYFWRPSTNWWFLVTLQPLWFHPSIWIWVFQLSFSHLVYILIFFWPLYLWASQRLIFLHGWIVNPTPNPQPGGPGKLDFGDPTPRKLPSPWL